MKKILSAALCVCSLSLSAQTQWSESSSGLPSSSTFIDLAASPSGTIYTTFSHYENQDYVPRLYKSTNNGTSWIDAGLVSNTYMQHPNALVFSGSTLLMAGTNNTSSSIYVYASTNGGTSWSLSNQGFPNSSYYGINDLAISPTGSVYAACSFYDGDISATVPKILVSTNSGASWSNVAITNTNLNNVIPQTIVFSGSKMLMLAFTGNNHYLYSSSNNGATWSLSETGLPTDHGITSITSVNNQELYLLYNGSNNNTSVYKSTNNGSSWAEVPNVTGLSNLANNSSLLYSSNALLTNGSSKIYKSTVSTTTPTGLNEALTSSSTISPNPFTDILSLEVNDATAVNVIITNIQGQVLIEENFETGLQQINASLLPNGVYIATINTQDGRRKTVRLIKE